jgi:hypothetical protein
MRLFVGTDDTSFDTIVCEGLRAIIATIRRGFEELHEARVALVGLDSEDVDYFPGPSGGLLDLYS